MSYVALFKPLDQFEFDCCSSQIPTYQSRMNIPKNSIVIAKYSTWPYPSELENDLKYINSKLINSSNQINKVNSFWPWYEKLENFTAKTYKSLEELPDDKSFILKGLTKSKKDKWNTHCFAKDKFSAKNVYAKLQEDSYITSQGGIIIREYIDNFVQLNDKPLFDEWRLFVANKQIISVGFYNLKEIESSSKFDGYEFAKNIIDKLEDLIEFYTIDLARCTDGSWKLIEINEGQMATLMGNDPMKIYKWFRNQNS